MSVRVAIVENPMDPREWEDHDVEDLETFLEERFGKWPETGRIYDLEGFEDLARAAGSLTVNTLRARDVTPVDEASADRLKELKGPLLISVAPGDPLTIIIAVVAVIVAVVASLLLMPKIPQLNNTYQSPNNTLANRSNQSRPGGRIPDIFGSVRSVCDLLAVPYKMFVDQQEVEIAYMCVGRGEYEISDVRDGDTLISAISGAGAAFYGPQTSPNSGDAPFLQIGTDINQPVLSVQQMNEVNGQVLRPPNSNFIRGDSSIRFVAPDLIVSTTGVDFTEYFEAGDEITVGGADFGDVAFYDATTQVSRFYPDKRIEFQSFNPTTMFTAGQQLVITNGGFAADNGSGNVLYIDVSGTEIIDHVTATTIYLV
jgi:hypothetical protein